MEQILLISYFILDFGHHIGYELIEEDDEIKITEHFYYLQLFSFFKIELILQSFHRGTMCFRVTVFPFTFGIELTTNPFWSLLPHSFLLRMANEENEEQ